MDNTMRAWLCGVGVGATTMFLLDPDRGRRRRALIRDKAVRAGRKTLNAADATARDLSQRASGITATARAMFETDAPDDRVLCARVRSELGRIASHPRAIAVQARAGTVTLAGDALASEIPSILRCVESVRGVAGVENHLAPHAAANDIAFPQGESGRPGQWTRWLRKGWSPTALLAAGVGAAAAAVTVAARAPRA